ncbi:MAG: hypothetical protein AMXMBFR56_77160 [Polyangiaceae bacterium]
MIVGYCKSAGTLIALGANSLTLFDNAELGPLDVQVRKADELGEMGSGLTPMQALTTLEARVSQMFRTVFLDARFETQLPTKLAAEIAATLTTGVYAPMFSQIDPLRLGEMDERGAER